MNNIVEQLSTLRPNSTFLSILNYKNSSNEVANFSIVFHMSYKTALEKSLEMIEEYEPTSDVEKKAQEQLINSYTLSLVKMEDKTVEMPADGYTHFEGVKGVKLHNETGNIHIYGLLNSKQVIEPGQYKEVKSSELTLTKKRLSKEHPVNKFRQFIVAKDKMDCIKVEKMEIIPE